MALTLNDATTARKGVLDAYGIYLPNGLGDRVRAMPIADIVKILPEDEYKDHFNAYFRNFFAGINVQAFGLERAIPVKAPTNGDFNSRLNAMLQERQSHDYFNDIPCPAFCAPAVNVTQRRIYVNADAAITIGTLYHEFVHFIQHSNLYPELYSRGGDGPAILEGTTEFLTRRLSQTIQQERASGMKYQAHFNRISGQIGMNMLKKQQLLRFSFQGEAMSL
jgi:hypothetical protein